MSAPELKLQPVVLLTGANGGIGRAVAKGLLQQGVRLLVVCRTPKRSRELVAELIAEFPSAAVTALAADLSSLASMRQLAVDVHLQTDRLDVLIHNAGYFASKKRLTTDGFESMLAVNYLAPFVLTHELLDLLRRAATANGEARILTVSSSAFRIATVNVRDLNAPGWFRPILRYGETKRAVLMFALEVAERLRAEPISSNALHPGLVNTPIMEKHSSLLFSWPSRLFRRFLKTPEQAAEVYVRLVLAPELRGVTGRYYESGVESRVPDDVRDPSLNHELWETVERLVALPDSQRMPLRETMAVSAVSTTPVSADPSSRQRRVMGIAAAYHAAVGFGLWFFPERLQQWFGIAATGWGVPTVTTILTMLGLALLMGLALSSRLELRLGLLRVAFLTKTAESALLLWHAFTAGWSVWVVALDVLWALPLWAFLQRTREAEWAARRDQSSQGALSAVTDQQGRSLAELSAVQPVLALCVRHTGCAFCREALADLSALRQTLGRAGMNLAVVHMSPDAVAAELCNKYGLSDISRISDPGRRVYAALGLPEGGLKELVPLSVWPRGYAAAISAGHGIGKIIGNVLQLAGAAVIWRGDVVAVQRSATACDRLDLRSLAESTAERCGLEQDERAVV